MLSPSWLFVVAMAHMCLPSWGSECWDSSVCANISSKQGILECIQICLSVMQSESPQMPSVEEPSLGLTSEDRTLESRQSHSTERRSYSMEHFRWGKPSGRKRRPVKVFASSLEGGGSTEAGFPLPARRQLGNYGLKRNSNPPQGLRSRPYEERKDGTYRMSHFRWGSPPATKRNGNLLKPRDEEKPRSPLAALLRNIMGKDIERMMG